ncbi:MAG TPA: PDR/VanB family oxidoreductase [Usitatibacter sp.]|nr:PDR/VanB family oxidoreductase [Usitatibacter sp.]
MELEVRQKLTLARDIVLFTLADPARRELTPFTAGSHLLVTTPNGREREYSICNSPTERHRYLIAVKREPAGGGGSASMIDELHAGTRLEAVGPRNHFPLHEEASSHLLIAGGIGITPLRAMALQLAKREADFELIYLTRSAEVTAFLQDLSSPEWAGRVRIHHDGGDPSRGLPLASLLAERKGNAHLYCCGPRGLMRAVRAAASRWPAAALHFEDFGTSPVEPSGSASDTEFTVRLVRSGICVGVPKDVTILEAIRRSGVPVPSSCESGTCGTCRTRLIEGTADHRDFVLGEDEQQDEIMICVSRAVSSELVLDL